MGKVIFTISYDIVPEKRVEYLPLSQKMKEHILQKEGVEEYSIFENRRKQNSFSEVFIFNSIDDYDGLEDEDDTMCNLTSQLESMLTDGKMKYSTLVEV